MSVPKSFMVLAVFLAAFPGLGTMAQTREIKVAAAADLQPVMPVLAAAFEHATGIKVVSSFGSSATLATQILNGQQVDLFLGADFTFPEKIVAAGMADTKLPIAYAKGTLVLWARKDLPLQPLSVETLSDPRLKKLAIANELHAPYGRAAASSLRYLKLYDKVASKLVVAENVSQAAQFVDTGNADAGMISLTLALSEHFQQTGTFVRLPTVTYPKMLQYGVVMKASPARSDAHAFLDWLTSPGVQINLPKHGLEPVN